MSVGKLFKKKRKLNSTFCGTVANGEAIVWADSL